MTLSNKGVTRRFTYILIVLLLGCQSPKSVEVEEVVSRASNTLTTPKPNDILVSWDYDTTLWSEILPHENIVLDLRYATADNFLAERVYDCPRCFLAPEMAKAVIQLGQVLYARGYRLVLFDCYRPISVQKEMWAIKPNKNYVTPPEKGSMHNRGLAVDMGLADLDGNLLEMGSDFDEFAKESHWTFPHEPGIMERRNMLRQRAEEMGLLPIRTEWWHYSLRNVRRPISNFEWSCP